MELDQIKDLLGHPNLQAGLNQINHLIEQHKRLYPYRNMAININARYYQLRRRKVRGLISEGEAMITLNEILFDALEMVESMAEEGFDWETLKSLMKSGPNDENSQESTVK